MASSPITEVTAANFDAEVMKSDKMVLIDFYADWCGPCKMISPFFEQLSTEFSDVLFLKVNVDDVEAVAAACEISAMPTFQV
jgi:thioredoxin 1